MIVIELIEKLQQLPEEYKGFRVLADSDGLEIDEITVYQGKVYLG